MIGRVTPAESNVFRNAAVLITVAGAVISIFLMFYVGRRNESVLVMGLFGGWVFSPFAGQLVAYRLSTNWTPQSRGLLHKVMVVTTVLSVVAYANTAFGLQLSKAAFPFLMAPLVSWLVTSVPVIRGLRKI